MPRKAVSNWNPRVRPIRSWNGGAWIEWNPNKSAWPVQITPEGITNPRLADGTYTRSPLYGRYGYARGLTTDLVATLSGVPSFFSEGQCVWIEVDVNTTSDLEGKLRNLRNATLATSVEHFTEFSAFLRQSNDAINMISDFAYGFKEGLQELVNSPKRAVKRAMKDPASWKKLPGVYLEYCYGWAPLADDLVNAVQVINDMSAAGYEYYMDLHKKITYEDLEPQMGQRAFASIYPGLSVPLNGALTCTREVELRTSYRFKIPQWFAEQNPRPLTPFSEAWELTKASFVLDWILPVGPWLQALENSMYSPFYAGGSETIGSRLHYRVNDGAFSVPGQDRMQVVVLEPGEIAESLIVDRRVLNEYPSAVFSRPALTPFPGLTQAAQGLSLLSQFFQSWR